MWDMWYYDTTWRGSLFSIVVCGVLLVECSVVQGLCLCSDKDLPIYVSDDNI